MTRAATNPWNPEAHLKALSTRELLVYLSQTQKFVGYYDVFGDHSGCVVTRQQVKDELSTRPHIPNKPEAKALRRIMAQTGMSEADVRKVPKFQTQLADAAAGTKAAE